MRLKVALCLSVVSSRGLIVPILPFCCDVRRPVCLDDLRLKLEIELRFFSLQKGLFEVLRSVLLLAVRVGTIVRYCSYIRRLAACSNADWRWPLIAQNLLSSVLSRYVSMMISDSGEAWLSSINVPLTTVLHSAILIDASPFTLHYIASLALAEVVALALVVLFDREDDFALSCIALNDLTQRLPLGDEMGQVSGAQRPCGVISLGHVG